MPRRLLSAAAACAFVLGLAACGDGNGETVTTPPPSVDIDAPSDGGGDGGQGSDGDDAEPSDGGGDTGTTAASDIPAPDPADYPGMDENTEEGAIQAFRYYIATSMWAHQTGDDSLFLAMQDPDCEGCPGFNEELPKLQEAGEYWSEFTVSDVQITPHDSTNFDYEIGYSFTISEHSRPDLEEGVRVDAPPIEYIAVGGMTWKDNEWILGGLNAEWGPDAHG